MPDFWSKKRVLLVEDEEESAGRVKEFLGPTGCRIEVVSDGPSALARARESPAPDLIILDVLIPKMSGFRVARLLKFDEKSKKIPILMLTVLGEASDREKGKAVGVDCYLTKPVVETELLEAVRKLVDG